ncbi:hypothetical protein ACFS07_31675 [Undibacterium arcticum]
MTTPSPRLEIPAPLAIIRTITMTPKVNANSAIIMKNPKKNPAPG